jgi:hypothetical protein
VNTNQDALDNQNAQITLGVQGARLSGKMLPTWAKFISTVAAVVVISISEAMIPSDPSTWWVKKKGPTGASI